MYALKGETARTEKPIEWIGSSKKELLSFPEEVWSDVGYSLYEVQIGLKPDIAKPLKGFGDASVQESTIDYNTDTYRVVYTVRFTEKVYVLHVFQKKSTTHLLKKGGGMFLS